MPPVVICQNCGKEFVDKDYRKPKYCSFDCYNQTRTKPIEKTCLYCGETFLTFEKSRKYCDRTCYDKDHENPSRYKSCEVCGKSFYLNFPERRFCSKKCRLRAGWNERDPEKRGVYICEWCGAEFESWAYKPNRFCSRGCAAHFGGSVGGRPEDPDSRVEKICEWCGESFTAHKSQVKHRNPRFCSRDCAHASWSVESRGENNPNWNGGTVDPDAYGPNWGRQKRKAKQRDDNSCQVCGYQAGGERFLDVHHIIPIRNFDGNWKKSNRLTNLICLCRPCHIRVEKNKIPCPEPLTMAA